MGATEKNSNLHRTKLVYNKPIHADENYNLEISSYYT